MRFIMFAIMLAFSSMYTTNAFAGGPWKVLFQDQKMPSQSMIEHQVWATPLGSSVTYFKSGQAISTVGATIVSSFSNSGVADYPRNVVLTPTGTTNNVASGTAVVSGKNFFGKAISENFSISAAQSSASTGSDAFKSISSVSFPQASGTGVTLSIGFGTKLGLDRCVDKAGHFLFGELAGVYETTRGTLAVDPSQSASVNPKIELNTFSPNGSMDGTKAVDLFFIQNFRCYGN